MTTCRRRLERTQGIFMEGCEDPHCLGELRTRVSNQESDELSFNPEATPFQL